MSKQLSFSGEIKIPSDAFEAADFLTKARDGFKEAAAAIEKATGVKVSFQTKVTTPRKPKGASAQQPEAAGEMSDEGAARPDWAN